MENQSQDGSEGKYISVLTSNKSNWRNATKFRSTSSKPNQFQLSIPPIWMLLKPNNKNRE